MRNVQLLRELKEHVDDGSSKPPRRAASHPAAGRTSDDLHPAAPAAASAAEAVFVTEHHRLMIVAIVRVRCVRVAAAALGEAAADHVGGSHDRDVQPSLAGDELVGPVGVAPLIIAAATRMPTTTAMNA